MLSSTKEGQHAVESVLKGDVDQYVLDGTDRVLTIPRSLLERVEKLPHQVSLNITLAHETVTISCCEAECWRHQEGFSGISDGFHGSPPAEFWTGVQGRPAESPVCDGTDEPRPAAPEGGASEDL